MLFEEQDGIWLKLQGIARKRYGSTKEMKLAIAYDGATETAKGRYNLSNKVACANFEGVNEFVKRKEGVIASIYNVDEIESRILNGDGAEWIKKSIADEDMHFQLDPFHRNKAIYANVKDKRKRAVLFELLKSGKTDDVFSCIEGYPFIDNPEVQYVKNRIEYDGDDYEKFAHRNVGQIFIAILAISFIILE